MGTRERILDATADLLWERGYTATSPQAIQLAAGVGQGSMYHHFPSKAALAAASLRDSGEQLRRSTAELLRTAPTPADAVLAYLRTPREALRGCRLGRMTQDVDVLADEDLRSPIAETLTYYQGLLAALLEEGQRVGQLRSDFSATSVAATLVAIIQGAHVLARAEQAPQAFERVVAGAVHLVEGLRTR